MNMLHDFPLNLYPFDIIIPQSGEIATLLEKKIPNVNLHFSVFSIVFKWFAISLPRLGFLAKPRPPDRSLCCDGDRRTRNHNEYGKWQAPGPPRQPSTEKRDHPKRRYSGQKASRPHQPQQD